MNCYDCKDFGRGRADGVCKHYIDNSCPYGYHDEDSVQKFPELQINDFITIYDNKEMRFFLGDEYEQFDGIIHPNEDYEFKEENITEVWRQTDEYTFKCIYKRNE